MALGLSFYLRHTQNNDTLSSSILSQLWGSLNRFSLTSRPPDLSSMELAYSKRGMRKYFGSFNMPFLVLNWWYSYFQTKPGLFKIATFRRWMVLATGPQLIEDVRKAPDDVLSKAEPLNEVRCATKWSVHAHAHHLVYSSRIHVWLVESERQIHSGSNSFQIIPGYCRHFPGGSRWARRGYGWFDPGPWAWYVEIPT